MLKSNYIKKPTYDKIIKVAYNINRALDEINKLFDIVQ